MPKGYQEGVGSPLNKLGERIVSLELRRTVVPSMLRLQLVARRAITTKQNIFKLKVVF
jgi:hypothetical protein